MPTVRNRVILPWMNNRTIGKKEQQKILAGMTPEQKLDMADREARDFLELKPSYGIRYMIESFQRKRRDDAQRAAENTQ